MVDQARRSAARTATLVAIPVALAVLLVSLLLHGGFGSAPRPQATGPVTVATRDLPVDAAGVCQKVVAHLPEQVLGRTRRPVTAGSEQNAAYGDPPVTLACGTPMPTFAPTDTTDVFVHDGVCWHPMPADGSTAWTTVDRTVPVTVTVPGPNEGSGDTTAAFSAVIRDNDPARTTGLPPGCTG